MNQDTDTPTVPTPTVENRVEHPRRRPRVNGQGDRARVTIRIDPRDRKRLDRLIRESRMNQHTICVLAIVAYLDHQDRLRRERRSAPPVIGYGDPVEYEDEEAVAV